MSETYTPQQDSSLLSQKELTAFTQEDNELFNEAFLYYSFSKLSFKEKVMLLQNAKELNSSFAGLQKQYTDTTSQLNSEINSDNKKQSTGALATKLYFELTTDDNLLNPGSSSSQVVSGNPEVFTQETAGKDTLDSSAVFIDHENGLTADKKADGVSVLGNFEIDNFVRLAPIFSEQMKDETRNNTFRYVKGESMAWGNDPIPGQEIVEMTEKEGMVGLYGFLESMLHAAANDNSPQAVDLKTRALALQERLTFIGEKEYIEAAKGIGDYWKSFLDADANNQLCVLTKIGERSVYRGKRKSDNYLFERIISTFSPEELEKYSGRIVAELDDIKEDPANTKVVMLDDWTISGAQIQDTYQAIKKSARFKSFADSVEVNLIAASGERISKGMNVAESNGWNKADAIMLPVKAYFKAHNAQETSRHRSHKAHMTGTHSSVDFDFEDTIDELMRYMRASKKSTAIVYAPPLTNIVRTYRYAPTNIEVSRDSIRRRGDL